MRVAVLADIHGNLPALDAVLNEIHAVAVDAIVLNGDIATGPMPDETLDRLAELGEKAIWVRGNADRELVAAYDGTLNPELLKRPARPPTTAHPGWTRDIGACSPICHCRSPSTSPGWGPCGSATPPPEAIPRSCSSTRRSSATEDAFSDTDEPTVVLGHTHMPLTGSPIAGGSSILGVSGCDTELGPRFGRCSVLTSPSAALITTPR